MQVLDYSCDGTKAVVKPSDFRPLLDKILAGVYAPFHSTGHSANVFFEKFVNFFQEHYSGSLRTALGVLAAYIAMPDPLVRRQQFNMTGISLTRVYHLPFFVMHLLHRYLAHCLC